MSHLIKKLKEDSDPSPYRRWYNAWVSEKAEGNVLDVGKSTYWDYGFPTIDTNKKLNPTIIGDICSSGIPDESYDTVLCNGMYECVENPQKMVDEVMRILKSGGTAIFGFVGEGYKPYKKPWKFYKYGDINFQGVVHREEFINVSDNTKEMSNQYHFILCKKI